MTLFQKQQTIHTSGYNAIPDAIADDETAAVPFVTQNFTSSRKNNNHSEP